MSRLRTASLKRAAISSLPRMLGVREHQERERLGPPLVPVDDVSLLLGRALHAPGLRDPEGDAPRGEGFPVVVVEPAFPPPASPPDVVADAPGLEIARDRA